MKVKIIGCSTTWTDRPVSSYCIDGHILVDCGEGTTKYYKQNGINFENIDTIFITHIHSDHFLGLSPFICLNKPSSNPPKLTIYGPKNITHYLNILKDTFAMPGIMAHKYDITDGINVIELNDGNMINIGNYKITAHKVNHIDNIECLSYSFNNSKTKLGFSGDTTYDDYLIKFIEDIDSAFLECSSLITNDKHLGADKYKEIIDTYPQKRFIATHYSNAVFNNNKNIFEFAFDGNEYNF